MAYQNIAWSALRTELLDRVDNARHWTNAEALIAFNDALHFWNLLTGMWRRTVTLTWTAPSGDAYLPVTGTMIWPMRMERSDGTPVARASIGTLHLAIPGWPAHTTATGGVVPTNVTFWAPRSLQHLVLYPRPTVTTSVTLDGVSETPVLSADGDLVDLDEGLHQDLLDLAAHWLQFKDGGPAFFETAEALDRVILRAGEENDEIRATHLYRRAQGRDRDQDVRRRMKPPDPRAPRLFAGSATSR